MKYYIMPLILEWTGIGLAIVMLYSLILMTQVPEHDSAMLIATASTIIGFLGVFNSLGNSQRLAHHKRILKKAGLWTDEYIKKKDLPKS